MDDEPLADDDELYRRLAPHHLRDDGTVNSSAYKRGKGYDPSISVDLKRLTPSPEDALRARPAFGLGVLHVGQAPALGLSVRRDPLPDNAAHCLIQGVDSRAMAGRLATITRVLIRPRTEPS